MSLEWRARSSSLAWSNPLAWWWGLLTLVSGANIAVWFLLYRQLHEQPTGGLGGTSGIGLMLVLCAAYVFGCAFRSLLPRADVQRICLFDTWLSSVVVGRSVATVAEICFVAQWAIILHQLGTMTGADTTVNAAWVIVPLILVAEPSVTRAVVLDSLAAAGARWQVVCTSSSYAGCIAAARGGLGLTVRSHFLAGRGLSPPVNRAALPELPKVEFIALGAKHLSRPAETLLEILQNSDLRGEWAGE